LADCTGQSSHQFTVVFLSGYFASSSFGELLVV
jgi:hypothetical protein